MTPYISTQKILRTEFWMRHPQFNRRGRAKQNSYSADIRIAWRNFVEHLRRSGDLSENLAQKATL